MRIGKPILLLCVAVLLGLSCTEKDKGTGTRDGIPPSRISDLAAVDSSDTSLTLTWTAPGDDDTVGSAEIYIIRYSFVEIADSTWDSCRPIPLVNNPRAAGSAETLAVMGLIADTSYHFAIRAADDAGNWSALSNDCAARTMPEVDTTTPTAITTLVLTERSATSLSIHWIAPSDDSATGRAAMYDIRYSTEMITELNFADADSVAPVPTPLAPGSREWFTVTGLEPLTTYYIAIRTGDYVGNWSALSNVLEATTKDGIPPAAITDLFISGTSTSSLTITWTAPGDDSLSGWGSYYAIGFSREPLTPDNFILADFVDELLRVGLVGSIETYTIDGLDPLTGYYVGIKTVDNDNQWSGLSNVVYGYTSGLPDTTPPMPVVLRAAEMKAFSISLNWIAPGDDGADGLAVEYDQRYSTQPIDESSWEQAIPWPEPSLPQAGGLLESADLTGLTPNTNYYFALRARDDAENWSELSNVLAMRTANSEATWQISSNTIGCNAVTSTPDGGVMLAGQGAVISHVDATGNILWSTGNLGDRYGLDDIVSAPGGGFVAVGSIDVGTVMNPGIRNSLWRKVNESGQIVWAFIRDLAPNCGHDWAKSVCPALDGGYIISGGNNNLYLLKISSTGAQEWLETFGAAGFDFPVLATEDGGYLTAGKDWPVTSSDIQLFKTDALGQLEWMRYYPEPADEDVTSIVAADGSGLDDRYLIGGWTQSYGNGGKDAYVFAVDSLGNKLWYLTFGGPGDDQVEDMIRTRDGNFVLAGRTYSAADGNDLYVVKFNQAGTIWERTFGGADDDRAYGITESTDGHLIVVGSSRSYGSGQYDAFLIKIDENGEW